MNSRFPCTLLTFIAVLIWVAPLKAEAGRIPPSHNWTVQAGGGTFGLIEWDFGLWSRPAKTGWNWKAKRTDVFLYKHSFHLNAPVEIVAGGFGLSLIGLSIGLGGAVNFVRRLRANRKNVDTDPEGVESALP